MKATDMPQSHCSACGQDIVWSWEEAFEKFGFGDGANGHLVNEIVSVLERHGYRITTGGWMLHNTVIESIKRDGRELIPPNTNVGYDDPRTYLPPDILALLDRTLSDQREVAS